MTPSEAKQFALQQIRAQTALPVRAGGYGQQIEVPSVEVTVNSDTRTAGGGHQSYAGETVDAQGVATGLIKHFYHRLTLEVRVRSKDEKEADDELYAICSHFEAHEDTPHVLDADLHRVAVDSQQGGPLMFVEPSWTEVARLVEIEYVDRVTESGEPIESVSESRLPEPDPDNQYYL